MDASNTVSRGHGATRSSAAVPRVSKSEAPAEGKAAKAAALQPLSREEIEAYLSRHRRDAASLLAAFHASFQATQSADPYDYWYYHPAGDVAYLLEAATNFPHDPRVQWVVLSQSQEAYRDQWPVALQDAFPEERRKWLDSFKDSLPENSLPLYLSAQDYFKDGQPEAALEELAKAATRDQFGDFALDIRLDAEQIYLAAGKSPREANMAALRARSVETMAERGNLKRVAMSLAELMQEYQGADDPESAQRVLGLGLTLADQLNARDSSGSVHARLTGISIEALMLQGIDQNQPCDLLGGLTPAQRLGQIRQQRDTLLQSWQFLSTVLPAMTDDEWTSYVQREKIYGEVEALRWLQQQPSSVTPSSGN